MAEDTEANADPSMEEILASIRKIISDENPPAEVAPAPAEPVVEPEPPPAPEPEPVADVLELTQMLQEDGSVVDLAVVPEPIEQPPPPAPPLPPPPPPVAPLPAPVVMMPSDPLVSDPVASSMASVLTSLANTVEIERLSSAPSGATYIGNGHRTLEDMVVELMRPMLKDWLDRNLPATVERLVQKEIERIARRS